MTAPHYRGQNRWIDTEDGFIGAAWYWPRSVAASTAVVLVPGIAHEERTMSGGLVALAEALADAGLPALLMDLHGCSQSAGRLDDENIGARWEADIKAAVRHARETGAERIIVVGVRLGFPLAAEALTDEPLAALVAWAPIVSGKRYVRELKVLQSTADADEAGTIAIGGFSFPRAVLERIAALDLAQIAVPDASCVMMREMTEGLYAPWLARLSERGMIVQEQVSTQIHPWLFGGKDQPELPHEDINGLARWCRALHDQQSTDSERAPVAPAPRPVIEFLHQGRPVRETFVEIGLSRLTGVLSEPVGPHNGHAVRLMVSTVGPGRAFADFARDEAARGNTSLRFDFAGFGTSGRGDAVQGGELYSDEGSRDVQAAIEYLREAGYRHIYSLGFCAGAWSMIQGGNAPELRAAVAINVALYRQPNPPPPRFAKRTREGLAKAALMKKIAARIRHKTSRRREPVEWLIRLCGTDARVLLAYADVDPGLVYLNGQMAKGFRENLRQPFDVQIYAGLGHLADGTSARSRLFTDIGKFFAGLDHDSALGTATRYASTSVSESSSATASDPIRRNSPTPANATSGRTGWTQ